MALKKIEGLGEVVKQVTGDAMRTGTDILTIRSGFATSLMMHKASAIESLRVLELAKKVWAADGSIELEDSEHALLKQVVEANPAGFYATVLAQIYLKVV